MSCEFFKDCEIFHSGRRIFFRGVHLSGSWYGGRIWRVRVLDQFLMGYVRKHDFKFSDIIGLCLVSWCCPTFGISALVG